MEWTPFRAAQAEFSTTDAAHRTFLTTRAAWFAELDRRIAATGKAPVIYIHGFFNSQNDAVDRALAIRHLLCPRTTPAGELGCSPSRPVIALTWPSYNRLSKYVWDEANNEWSQQEAVELVLDIASHHAGAIVIAHSMGNRILLAAASAAMERHIPLGQLVLASADVDRGTLASLLQRQSGLGYPATIYASRRDEALSASWRLHGYPRAGDLSNWVSGRTPGYPYANFHAADIIDTTDLNAGVKGHAAFIETPEAAADLCHVLADDPVKPGRTHDSAYAAYWVIEPGPVADDDCAALAKTAVRIAKGQLH